MELSPIGTETINRVYTNAMPKMTPQQRRKLQRLLGKDATEEVQKPSEIPSDVMYQIRELNEKIDGVTSVFFTEMKKLMALMKGEVSSDMKDKPEDEHKPVQKKHKKEEVNPIQVEK